MSFGRFFLDLLLRARGEDDRYLPGMAGAVWRRAARLWPRGDAAALPAGRAPQLVAHLHFLLRDQCTRGKTGRKRGSPFCHIIDGVETASDCRSHSQDVPIPISTPWSAADIVDLAKGETDQRFLKLVGKGGGSRRR